MSGWWERWVASLVIPPELEKTMYREYSYLLYIGGMFVKAHPKWAILSVIQMTLYVSVIAFMGGLFLVTLFTMKPDLIEVSIIMNYVALTVCNYSFLGGFIFNRKAIVTMLTVLTEDFYSYDDSFVLEEMDQWKQEVAQLKYTVVTAVPVYFCGAAAMLLGKDWIDQLFGYDTTPTSDYDEAGIYQVAPMKMWYPFTITGPTGRKLIFIHQMVSCFVQVLCLACAVVLMTFPALTVNLQMKILFTAINKMEDRAVRIYEKENSGFVLPEDPIERKANKKFDRCRTTALKQVVEHHHVIREFFEAYELLIKWPTVAVVIMESVMVAMSIMSLLEGVGGVPSTIIITVSVLIGEFLTILILCEMGEKISIWNDKVFNAMYEFNWTDFSSSNNKYVLIFKECSKRPMLLKAGGLTPINRDTFSSIMNTAYSYVNLMRARR